MKKFFGYLKVALVTILVILTGGILYRFLSEKKIKSIDPIEDIEKPIEDAKEKHDLIIDNNDNANKTNTQTPEENDEQLDKDTKGMTEDEIEQELEDNPDFLKEEDEELNDILKLSK